MSPDLPGPAHPRIHVVAQAAVRWWWLWAVLAMATGAITVSAAGTFNIVALELAGTLERANDAVAGTDPDTIRSAIFWDFVFVFFYALALCTGSLWTRRQLRSGFGSRVGVPIAIGAAIAGMLDIVENLSMLGYLNSWTEWSGWIPLAGAMAIPKFVLVFASIAYVLAGIGTWAFRWLAHHRRGR